jgi:hypothetical protein
MVSGGIAIAHRKEIVALALKSQLPSRETNALLLIYSSPAVHEKLRQISFERRESMGARVRQAVDDWLQKTKRKRGKRHA